MNGLLKVENVSANSRRLADKGHGCRAISCGGGRESGWCGSCPDPANPCKHIAATHYILGEHFDEDPFLIFRLRGRTQEQVIQALRGRRVGSDEAVEEETEEVEVAIPLKESISNYWDFGAPLEGFSVSIHPPVIEMPLLKRLGKANFVPEPGIQSWLSAAYQAVSRKAIQTAFKDANEG